MEEQAPGKSPLSPDENKRNDPYKNSSAKNASADNSFNLQMPSINLPKGGGALKNIDEKFEVNAANGTASFNIPLPFSKSRGELIPVATLNYDSGSGNGPFGLGWSLNYPSIQRRTDKQLPLYQDALESDVFLLAGAEDLVPALIDDGTGNWLADEFNAPTGEHVRRYRPRIEGGFSRIEKITPQNATDFFWKITTKENLVTIYGQTAAARITGPGNHIFKWIPEYSYDDKGNCIVYEYVTENLLNVPATSNELHHFDGTAPFTNKYLKRIKYGNANPYTRNASQPYAPSAPVNPASLFETVFDYGDHDDNVPLPSIQKNWPCRFDPFSDFHAGFEIRTYRLCRRILFFHNFKELNDNVTPAPCLVRSIDLSYKIFLNPSATSQQKRNAEVDFITAIQQRGYKKTGNTYSRKSLPPVELTYQELQWNTTVQDISPEDLVNAPKGIQSNYQWLDLRNEGISGILTEQANGWFYKSNLGDGKFSVAESVIPKPSFLGFSNGGLQLQDLEADGRKFVVNVKGPLKGYFELTDKQTWERFETFDAFPNVDFSDPDTKFIDVDGDGRPELIISGENIFTWYPSKGVAGYDAPEYAPKPYDEEKGAALVFEDSTQSIFLADMSGDGLTDIVRIRNGECCYWPNMGYGKFGTKVSMDNAPYFDTPDLFNPSYLHLSDISGTGATDIVYLGKNQFKAWINLSGNGWSETTAIDFFPNTESPNQFNVIDLLGKGTSCIVWSSTLPAYSAMPMRYIDLMGGKKPFVMTGYKNNFGKEVKWDYKSSTQYYLEDKKAGNPWITRLAFPVQCVSVVEIRDQVAGTFFTNSYTYHHGYYDHAEREFRGFGRVEQTDTEVFETFKLNNSNNVVEDDLHQPPVKTVSWYHTGAFINLQDILDQYETEFNRGPQEFSLPPSLVPSNLTPIEYREASRACKSMLLRKEVYSPDGTLLADAPYSVNSKNCFIRQLQPKLTNRFAVYLVHESESAEFYYERDLNDPRVQHTLNLEIDEKGNVLQMAVVGYARKTPDMSLPTETRAEQGTTRIRYTTNSYTADVDFPDPYRVRVLAETKTYELTKSAYNAVNQFTITDLLTDFAGAVPINYESNPSGALEKRLLEQVRTIFLDDDLKTRLAFPQVDTMGLVYQRYKLAFTPALLTHHFGANVTNVILADAHYEQIDGANWWIPSGRNIYLGTAEIFANAKARFFQPIAVNNSSGFTTNLEYDDYSLLLTTIEDPLLNTTVADAIDYRSLQITRLKDLNDNFNETVLDELNRVIATSIYGNEDDGAHGDDPLSSYVIIEPINMNEVMSNPQKFLQHATSFFYYDDFAWMNTASPSGFAGIARETHESELNGGISRVLLSAGYSNGIGQLLQTKTQAEPGEALQWQAGVLVTVDTTPALRWATSGRTVMNNKGNPVKQYEPFFSTTFAYEAELAIAGIGFTSLFYYDALGRKLRVENADGTFNRVEFTAWKQLTFDENDTVLEPSCTWYSDRGSPNPLSPEPANVDTRAAWISAKHANTPAQTHLDPLGRTILSVADNGVTGKYPTRWILDIEDLRREVIDPRGHSVMQYAYDIAGRNVYQKSSDSGERWHFPDVAGQVVYGWDSLKHRLHTVFDKLNRMTEQWLVPDFTVNLNEIKIGFTVYGEGQLNDKTFNLRGKPYREFDQSGLTENTFYDFKGNSNQQARRITKTYNAIVNFNIVDPLTLLQAATFTSKSRFDAINKPVELDLPDGSRILPQYNEASLLNSLDVFLQSRNQTINFVQNIDYNAKGQRESIVYGNNTATRYTYDERRYRIIRLLTTRNAGADILQDLNYTYDAVANITTIRDNAQQTIYFNNAGVDPSTKFEYDAIYQLTHAIGREHAGSNVASDQFDADKTMNAGLKLVLKGDMNAMQQYEQLYDYDDAGNMLHMIHNAGNGVFSNKWTRTFTYNVNNNQLHQEQVGVNSNTFSYDAHGNMLNLVDGNFNLTWNYADQLQKVDLGGGGTAYYVYDKTGQRIRKVIENGNLIKERIYLGNYERYRETLGNQVNVTRETLHIIDGDQRMALVETVTEGGDQGLDFLIRYQYSNHLGTCALEVNGDPGNPSIISYEEYYPFGSTAYQAMRSQTETPKRYRYTGKERDEETGLYYHGARYCACWLARWLSPDPKGIEDGVNMYRYVKNNPIKKSDPTGTDDKPKTDDQANTGATKPPEYLLLWPGSYQSWGDQFGKDSGEAGKLGGQLFLKSEQFELLKKLLLDPQLSQLKTGAEKAWKDDKAGLFLGGTPFALSTLAILTYLAVENPKLDLPIVGKTPGRTLAFGALSLGLKGLSAALDDKLKLSVEYKEDDAGKASYGGELEAGDKQGSFKVGITEGEAEKGFKFGIKTQLTPKVDLGLGYEYKIKGTAESYTFKLDVPVKLRDVNLFIQGQGFIQPPGAASTTEGPFKPNFNLDDPNQPSSLFQQPFQGSGFLINLTITPRFPEKKDKK